MEEQKLLSLFWKRDESALTVTQERYGKLCFQIAKNILGDPEDAKECVNDAYLKVWNAIPPAMPEHFSAYLCKVVRNEALKKAQAALRQKRNRNLVTSFEELEEILLDGRAWDALEEGELLRMIQRFLLQESEEARKVFLRKYYFFDSIGAITKRYGFSQSKVKSMLFHTRNRLKEYLIREGVNL